MKGKKKVHRKLKQRNEQLHGKIIKKVNNPKRCTNKLQAKCEKLNHEHLRAIIKLLT